MLKVTFQSRRSKYLVRATNSCIGDDNITALRRRIRFGLFEHVDLLIPISCVTFDKLNVSHDCQYNDLGRDTVLTEQAPSPDSPLSPR